jgi:hypothetical protein
MNNMSTFSSEYLFEGNILMQMQYISKGRPLLLLEQRCFQFTDLLIKAMSSLCIQAEGLRETCTIKINSIS